MVVPSEDFQAVVEASHAVIEEAKAAGVYVFGGGIDEGVAAVLMAGDGTVTPGTYPGQKVPNGGYTVLELPSREAALEWAAKIAVACRCSQEVRQFQYDPASSRGTSARVRRVGSRRLLPRRGRHAGRAWPRRSTARGRRTRRSARAR